MLNLDNNKFILALYNKSIKLHESSSGIYEIDDNFFDREENEYYEHLMEETDQPMSAQIYEKLRLTCKNEASKHYQAIYKYLKSYTASDVYLLADPSEISASKYLPANINYYEYPRKKQLLEIIQKIMQFQDSQGIVDFHPNYNDLNQEMKDKVDSQKDFVHYYKFRHSEKQQKIGNLHKSPCIRNILHQSLQPYHSSYSNINQKKIIKTIQERKSKIVVDTWGKLYASSPSQFLWLPAQFIYSSEDKIYKIQGKLFHPLEECEYMPELKAEVGELLTYFAPALKTSHEHFSKLVYQINHDYFCKKLLDLPGQKNETSFDEKIHAIVKITEMSIEPHSTYTGQWHVEGYSSDNILYTCLYVIQQDEQLKEGRLKFKRSARLDDAPLSVGTYQPQCAHSFCPDYESLCDPHQLIPLGSLDIKENLMIVFPNQNIHKVKGFKNETDAPLKRKIIAFFVVDHETQPLTINDVSYTKPLSFIKEQRLLDMYERSKNKQTETQNFNYCEH